MNSLIRNMRSPRLYAGWMMAKNYSNAAAQKHLVIEPLEQRQLVCVKGEDIISFLQGLTTNDMRQLEASSLTTSIYTMFLNKAGRVLYDAIMYRSSADASAILIECDKDVTDELMRHLKLYRVRRKIQIDSLTDEFKIWCTFDATGNACQSPPSTDEDGIKITNDPRLPALGQRIITTADKTLADISRLYAGNVTVNTPSNSTNYRLHRYKLGIAEGVLDMPPGKQFPLEANCDLLNGVSFNKGCYIGQELTARVHHTGVIRKRHMPIVLQKPLTEKSIRVVQNEVGANVGTILGSVDNRAVGLLRMEQILKAKELVVDKQRCDVEKPIWWPPSLFSNVPKREEV